MIGCRSSSRPLTANGGFPLPILTLATYLFPFPTAHDDVAALDEGEQARER